MSTPGSVPPRYANSSPGTVGSTQNQGREDARAKWVRSLYEKNLLAKEALPIRFQNQINKSQERKARQEAISREVLSRSNSSNSLMSAHERRSSAPPRPASVAPAQYAPSNNGNSSAIAHVDDRQARESSSLSYSSESEQGEEQIADTSSRELKSPPNGKPGSYSTSRTDGGRKSVPPTPANTSPAAEPLAGEEAIKAVMTIIRARTGIISGKIAKLRKSRLEKNPHEIELVKSLKQAASNAERKKILSGTAAPGTVIAIGSASKVSSMPPWEAGISIYLDQIASAPEKFIVLVDGLPSSASRGRMNTTHSEKIPPSLLGIEGLEIAGLEGAPLQFIFSNASELSQALTDKASWIGLSAALGNLLQRAIDRELMTGDEKKAIEKAYASIELDYAKGKFKERSDPANPKKLDPKKAQALYKISRKLDALTALIPRQQVLTEFDSPLVASGKRNCIEDLHRRYPDRTIIVLDTYAQMQDGTRMYTDPQFPNEFQLDPDEDVSQYATELLRARPFKGWLDSLDPALRKATYSFAIDAADENSEEIQAKTTATAKSDFSVDYGFSTQSLGLHVQKMHTPSIMVSSSDLANLRG